MARGGEGIRRNPGGVLRGASDRVLLAVRGDSASKKNSRLFDEEGLALPSEDHFPMGALGVLIPAKAPRAVLGARPGGGGW